MDVSVVIVSWRVPERLRACLRSIEDDPFGGTRDVWVVDNASGDGTPEAVAKEFPAVNLIANRTNLGFPRAVNQALEKARGRVAFLLNPDARVMPGCTDAGWRRLADRPDVGVLGARVENERGEPQAESHRRFPTLWSEICEITTLARRFPGSPLFDRWRLPEPAGTGPSDVPCTSGAAVMVRREVIDRLGGLDASCPLYLEDLDLCWRAREAGWRVEFHPGMRVVHTGGASASRAAAHVRALNHRARYGFFAKHRGLATARAYRAIVAAAMTARLLSRPLRALAGRGLGASADEERRALRWAVRLDDGGWGEIGG